MPRPTLTTQPQTPPPPPKNKTKINKGGYRLALTLPDTDRFHDDKLNVAERAGFGGAGGAAASWVLTPESAAAPDDEMLAFLRLMQLSGE